METDFLNSIFNLSFIVLIGDIMKKKRILLFSLIFAFILYLLPSSRVFSFKQEEFLLDKIVVLDPGHGGIDDGACEKELLEDLLNLEICKYLYDLLFNSGAQVYITRTGDYDLANMYSKNRKKDDLLRRTSFINNINPDVLISIHMNAFNDERVNGSQVFFYHDNNLASYIQEELNQLNDTDKKIKKDDYYILEKTKCDSVLVECGFLTGDKDYFKLQQESYKKDLARSIYNGLIKFFNNFN